MLNKTKQKTNVQGILRPDISIFDKKKLSVVCLLLLFATGVVYGIYSAILIPNNAVDISALVGVNKTYEFTVDDGAERNVHNDTPRTPLNSGCTILSLSTYISISRNTQYTRKIHHVLVESVLNRFGRRPFNSWFTDDMCIIWFIHTSLSPENIKILWICACIEHRFNRMKYYLL